MDSIKWGFKQSCWIPLILFLHIRLISFRSCSWLIIIGRIRYRGRRSRRRERIMLANRAPPVLKKSRKWMIGVWNSTKVMLIVKVTWPWMKACLIILALILCLRVEKTEKVHLEAKLRINFKSTLTQCMILSIPKWRRLKIYKLCCRKTTNCSFWIYAKASKTPSKARKRRKKTNKK